MDDFGMLGGDFGFKPLGKSAPMTPGTAAADSPADRRRDDLLFDDVFGGASRSSFDYDSAFRGSSRSSSSSRYSSVPGCDRPVYDDEFFVGGLKAPGGSSAAKYDDVFESFSSSPMRGKDQGSDQFGDFVGNLGKTVPNKPKKVLEQDTPAFDDLLPGFGAGGGSSIRRPTSDSNRSQKSSPNLTKQTSNAMEDPFVVLESTSNPVSSSGLFMDPMDEFSKFSSFGNTKPGSSSGSGSVFDDLDPFDNLGKHMPRASSDFNHRGNDGSPFEASPVGKEQTSNFSAEVFENHSQKKAPVESFQEANHMSNTSSDFHRSGGQAVSPPSYASATANEMDSHIGTSPRREENLGTSGDVWLTVSEVPLFTQPTSAPPPSRPPPLRPTRVSKSERRSFGSTSAKNKSNEFSSFSKSSESSYSPKAARNAATSSVTSQMDELENFVMGWNQNNVNEDFLSGEEVKSSPDAAAKKEAMDRAEAEFRHVKEGRGKEHHKTARSRESINMDKNEKIMQDAQEKELRERLDHERQQKEREEEEREQRRLEKEREQKKLEKAREMEREREKARQAVERATREARERAAAEARLRAERAAAEKAQNEAREREKAAVQRALAEARERAAAEAKERAEKAAAEAREREARASASRAETDSRSRAERASAERAAETAAKVHQQNNDDDLETFFSMGSSRPSSAPNSSDPLFDADTQRKGGPAVARTTSVGASSNIRKTSSSTNIDDLSSIFGAAPSSGSFPDIEGETEERRRARLERHQRTQERAAKALAEKNQRDLQVQREQAERHRIAETLDVEIKRWAAGKEGNIRALLSTLQYVLWPECGWQPVSLTDMIPAASVKKIYRKATLRIHPDKVQQKGANLQQKYIAEKVFDLLQEAWKKFNSEELF